MHLSVEPEQLAGILLFRGLTATERGDLAALLRRCTFRSGANVVASDEPGDVAYVITRGAVKVHLTLAGGRDVIFAILGRGEVIGEMSLLDSLARSATATTVDRTETLWMDRTTFQQALQTIPTLNFNLAQILSRRLRMADAQIQALAALDLYGRVARQILAFALEYGEPGAGFPASAMEGGTRAIPFRLTQADLGSLVGASRGRVNQALSRFRDQKLISLDTESRVVVHDMEGLARYCL